MPAIIDVSHLSKTYGSGFRAFSDINLEIRRGEIFALLGPNGAGKTTLISTICGIVNPSEGRVTVNGHDIVTDHRAACAMIGRSRAAGAHHRRLRIRLGDGVVQLWPVRSAEESGAHRQGAQGAVALEQEGQQDHDALGRHETARADRQGARVRAEILFLDEPTAGVDVELRRDMWNLVRDLKANGVTIILTTHYIEEAEEMADRIGVINKGEIVLVEEKAELMRKLGQKKLALQLEQTLDAVPAALAAYGMTLSADGHELTYTYDAHDEPGRIIALLRHVDEAGVRFKDLQTTQSSLEDIFVSLVREGK